MNITRREQSKLHAVITIEVSAKDVEKNVEKVLNNYRKEASLPGFRKGKAPLNIVKKKYEDNVLNELIQKVIDTNKKK